MMAGYGQLQRWVDITCECGWRTDQLHVSESKAVWRQYRGHKAECHPEKLTARQKLPGWVDYGDTFDRKIHYDK